jgi:hypothetical protein
MRSQWRRRSVASSTTPRPASGAVCPSLVAVALAAAVVAWRDLEVRWIPGAWPVVRGALATLAALLVLDAVSLLVVDVSFRIGHTVVTGIWAAVALGAVALGARRKNEIVTTAGFVWLTVAFVKAWPAYDWTHLGHHLGAVSLLAVAVPMVLAGVALRVLDDSGEPLSLVSGVCATIALVSFVAAIDVLVPETARPAPPCSLPLRSSQR